MHRLVEGLDLAAGGPAAAAEFGRVGVEDHFIDAVVTAHLVAFAIYFREVQKTVQHIAVLVFPLVGEHRVGVVIGDDPLEAFPAVVDFPERGGLFIEVVEGPRVRLQFAVHVVVEQVPVELALVVPLAELAELAAHEEEFLAGVGVHVGQHGADTGELLGVLLGVGRVARMLVDEGAFAVDDFIVRDGQDEVLGEGVEEGEGQTVVVVLPTETVEVEVADDVVHPAHVPFEVEAEAADGGGLRNVGPRGGLFGDHHDVAPFPEDGLVEFLQERDGFEVLDAAVGVGDPLAVLAVIVEVQHGRDGVDTDAVDVVLVEPEVGVRDEEALDFRLAEVEDLGAPGLVLAFAGVRVLVAGLAVELEEAVGVLREVGGDPVEDDPDAVLVALVDEVHEVGRCAVPGSGGVVAADLIAPGPVEGVLGEGHEFDVRVAHVGDVRNEFVRESAVRVQVAVFIDFPGTGMHFIDVDGHVVDAGGGAVLEPLVIVPGVAVVDVIEFRGCPGSRLHMIAVGVGLHDGASVSRLDGILIGGILFDGAVGSRGFPDAVGDLLHP